MSLKSFALATYCNGSQPLRWVLRSQRSLSGQVPLCVLFYHRVADEHPNGWSIGNDLFERQILWLKERADLVSLAEVQSRLASGQNDRPSVAITFDDGYADNCQRAIPFLLEHQIPITYFVTLGNIVDQAPFPHDLAEGVPLAPNTPEQLRAMSANGIEIGAHTRTHPDIAAITDPDELIDEVVTATVQLGELVEQPIRYFAFPFGLPHNMCEAAVHLAKQIGLAGICSAFGAYNLPGQDPFHIRRIHGDPNMTQLRNWITLDPRKLSLGRDFQFNPSAVRIEDLPPDQHRS